MPVAVVLKTDRLGLGVGEGATAGREARASVCVRAHVECMAAAYLRLIL